MSEPYPLPSNAAYIWMNGDSLCLGIPGSAGVQAHTVVIPLDKCIPATGMTGLPLPQHRGFAVLLDVLRARMASGINQKIGHRGAMPRHAIEEACASDDKYKAWGAALQINRKQQEAEKAEAEAFLKELGL